ncbi:MAG: hypothetical protein KAU14_06395, partial [Thermoplasmata archaeon]|nr:hypothetical protein [Thermoplasmata archaeon]
MKNIISLGLVFLLTFSGLIISFDPHDATAQPVPEYRDASDGLPTYSLWVSKPEFFDIDNDGTGDLEILGPRKGGGDRSLHVFKWDGNSWSNCSSEEGT